MRERRRVVVDTNIFVSRLLMPESLPGRAAYHVIEHAQLIMSDALFDEVVDVLARPKFDAYMTIDERQNFIESLGMIAEMAEVLHRVKICRDSKDDCVLEAALNGSADLIITGDKDLLALHPFRGITILSPAEYLKHNV